MTSMLHIRAPGSGRCIGYLIPSATEPDVYYATTPTWCGCRGYQFRRRCRHITAAKAYIDSVREPLPAALVISGLQGMAAQRGESTVWERFEDAS